MLPLLTSQLAACQSLDPEQTTKAVELLLDGEIAAEDKAEFLVQLARKGETVEEIAVFARTLRNRSVALPIDHHWRQTHEILDVCGTGGDGLNTFNISTTVAIICAAAGVPVAKHGNRAITSQAGSADVLDALGIPISLSATEAACSLQERNFAFLFAPNYHPAFKHIGPARKLCAERGQRTIFNFLGPLLNPARPSAQLIGVPRSELCEPIGRVLQTLGVRRGMIVSGKVQSPKSKVQSPLPEDTDLATERCLDELSILGENTIAEFYQDRGFNLSVLEPNQFGVKPATIVELSGGDAQTNAGLLRALLAGKDRGARRDAVLLNSAAALFVAGRVRSLGDGWELAAATVDHGDAMAKLEELRS